jgi:hypothetical protein
VEARTAINGQHAEPNGQADGKIVDIFVAVE